MPKIFKFFSVIFSFIGFILIISGGYSFYSNYVFMDEAELVDAKVIKYDTYRGDKGKTFYTPVYKYNFRGKEYINKQNFSSNIKSHDIGSIVKIYALKIDPNDIRENSFTGLWLGSLIITLVGLFFFSFGFGIFYINYKKSKFAKRLKSIGYPLTGEVVSVVEDLKVSYNKVHPLKLIVEKKSGRSDVQRFESYSDINITSDMVGASVTVYVNQSDKSEYYVDIDSLSGGVTKVS